MGPRGPMGGRHGHGHGADGPESFDGDGRIGGGPDIGDPDMPIDSTRTMIVSLPNNPGTYTIPAADLQAFVAKTQATVVHCMISQATRVSQTHDAGSVKLVIGNDDQVRLTIQ
jgi:hypothetical protein